MTRRIDSKETTKTAAATVLTRHGQSTGGDLTGIVRFLARRAAERTWKALQAKATDPPREKEQGDRP
ncbi:MAG: hypothetical protein AAGC79_09170 [Pseudomonadota bacterium]